MSSTAAASSQQRRQTGFAATLRHRFVKLGGESGPEWNRAGTDDDNEDAERAAAKPAFSSFARLPPTLLAYVALFLPAQDAQAALQCNRAWHLRGADMMLLIRMRELEAHPPPSMPEPSVTVTRQPGETVAQTQARLALKRLEHDRWQEQSNASTAVLPASYQPLSEQPTTTVVDPPWRQLHQWSVQHVLVRLHNAPPPVPERPLVVTSLSCSEILADAADFSDLVGIRSMRWRVRRLGIELVVDLETPSAATLAGPDAPPEEARLKIHAQLWALLRRRFAPTRAPLSVTVIDGDHGASAKSCAVVAFGTRWAPPQSPQREDGEKDGFAFAQSEGSTPPLRLHSLVFRTRHMQWMLDTLCCLATPLSAGSRPPLPPELAPDDFPRRRALNHLVPLNHIYFRSASNLAASSSVAERNHMQPLLRVLSVLAESLQVGLAETLLQPRILSLYVDSLQGPSLCLESFLESVSVLRARGLLAQLRNLYLLGVSPTLLSPPNDSILPPPFLSVESLVLRGGCLRLPQASFRLRRRAERTPPHAYPLLWRSFPAVYRLELCDVVVPSLAELHSGWLPLQFVKLVDCSVVEDNGLLDLAEHVYSQRRVTHLQRLQIVPSAKPPSVGRVGADVAMEAMALLLRPLSRSDALYVIPLFFVSLAVALAVDVPLALWCTAVPKILLLRAALLCPSLFLLAWALFEWDAGMRSERPRGAHNIPLVPPPLTSLMAACPKQLLLGFAASVATMPFTYSIASSVLASLLMRLLLSLHAPRRQPLRVRWNALLAYSVRFLALRALQLYCLGVGAQILSAAGHFVHGLAQSSEPLAASGAPLLSVAYHQRWQLLTALRSCFSPFDWRRAWFDCTPTAPWVTALSHALDSIGAGPVARLVTHTVGEGVLLGVLMALILSAQRWLLPRLYLFLIDAPVRFSPLSRKAMRLVHHAIATVFAVICSTTTW